MAKNFVFRLDSEGVEQLKKQLTDLGTGGTAAFDSIKQSSPQLADALKRAEDAAEKARQKLLALGVSGQQVAQGMSAVGRANLQALEANNRLITGMTSAGRVVANTNTQLQAGSLMAGNFGRNIQNAGFQVADFAVQVSAGQSPLRAFVQQGSQVLGAFGPWGAVIGAAVAVVGGLALQMDLFGDSAESAEEKQEKFNTRLEKLSDLMDEIRGKAPLTRAAMQAAVDNLIFLQQGDVDAATKALTQKLQEPNASRLTPEQRTVAERAALRQERLELQIMRAERGDYGDRFSGSRADAAAALDFVTKERERQDKEGASAAKQRQKAEEDARKAIEKQIATLKEEQEQLKMTSRERFIRGEMLKAEQKIQQGLIENGDDYLKQIREEAGALFDANAAIEARKDAERELTRTQREQARERERIAKQEADAIGDFFQDLFNSLASGGPRQALSSLAGTLVGGLDLSAVFGKLLGGKTSGSTGGSSGLGGSFSLGGGLGTFLFGSSGASPSAAGSATAAEYALASQTPGLLGTGSSALAAGFGGVATVAGYGIGLATAENQQQKAQAMGGMIGAAAGAVIGSIIPGIGTAIGAVVGGMLGSVAGGLFGGNPQPKASAWIKIFGGQAAAAGLATKNDGDPALVSGPRDRTVEAINTLLGLLGGATLGSGDYGMGNNILGAIANKGGSFYASIGGKNVSFSSVEKAQEYLATQSIVLAAQQGQLQDTDPRIAGIIAQGNAKNIKELTTDVGLARLAYDLPAVTGPAIEFTKAMRDLEAQFRLSRKRAAELGLDLDEKLGKELEKAKGALQEQYFGQFREYERQLTVGPQSILSPEAQFAEAQKRFQEAVTGARKGDDVALGQVIGAGNTYLSLARQHYASSQPYADAFNEVLSATREFGKGPEIQIDTTPIVSAVQTGNNYLQIIAQFMKEMRNQMRDSAAERGAAGGLHEQAQGGSLF